MVSKKNSYNLPFHYMDFPVYAKDGSIKYKKPFIEQVERVLRSDMQEYDTFGCLIKNCHTHAGSKLHFNNFIEAELLFHNSYYNRAFAKLTTDWLWDDYLKHEEKYKNVLIIGYEMYSELYLQELREKLKEKRIEKCEYCVYETISKNLPDGSRQRDTHIRNLKKIKDGVIEIEHGNQPVKFDESDTLCVFIVPINTSLSTMDKMVAKFRSMTDNKKDVINRAHISLITLGTSGDNSFFTMEGDMLYPLEDRFENLAPGRHRIKNLVHVDMGSDTLVKDCSSCFPDIRGNEPLIKEKTMFGVDRNSVVPMIKIGQRKYQEPIDMDISNQNMSNLPKVYKLSEFLQYRHIARGENHYQYYFDTEKFLQENICDIRNSLESIECDFNIKSKKQVFDYLVAPRHQSNSGWVHLVNKMVFRGNARIIYFDVDKEYRSNIKAKYSDLTAALENIQNSGQDFLVRFHFVDDVVQSGSTFLRAKNLFNSLTRSITDKNSISLFNSIILLINRLSLDSQRFYLSHENTDRFYFYVDVNISPMRNYEDACTLCKLISDYHIIKNGCATNKLSDICLDVIKRHEICSSFDIDVLEKDTECNRQEKKFLFYISHLLNECMGGKLKFEGNSFSVDTVTRVDEIKEFLLRCYGSNSIFELLQIENGTDRDKVNKNLLKIAFIKAVSRPFFVYHIRLRQAAFSFCLEVIDKLLFEGGEPDVSSIVSDTDSISEKLEKSPEQFNELSNDILNLQKHIMQFPEGLFSLVLLKTLVKALADMNANYLIRKKVLDKLFKFAEKGESFYISMNRLTSNIKAINNAGNPMLEEILKNAREADYFITGIFTNDSLLHYLKKDVVLSRDETKSLLLEHVLLSGNEKTYFNLENIGRKPGIKDFTDETGDITVVGRMYLENNTILKHILSDEGNLKKLIKELEREGEAYRADNLYFFENLKSLWEINIDGSGGTVGGASGETDSRRILAEFKTFFEEYEELKSAVNSFAGTDANKRKDFSWLINKMLADTDLQMPLQAIIFVHDSNEKNPLFQFYTIAEVPEEHGEELTNCRYRGLEISQAFFHDDNICEIKSELDGKKAQDIFFIEDKLTNNNKKTLIIRFSDSQKDRQYNNRASENTSDESIYIQIFGFNTCNELHWFALKLLLTLRENFMKLIADVNLQELIEERKVEMKQKALSINKATTHSKAEKYYMSRPVTENISEFWKIADTIINDWTKDEGGKLPDDVDETIYREALAEYNKQNRIERRAYDNIMKMPSYNLRHRWTLYDKYYQLLSDEMLSTFYRKIIGQKVGIDNAPQYLKRAIKTVFDPTDMELSDGLAYKSKAYITIHNEGGYLAKCRIIFEFEQDNPNGELPYVYRHTCNMSIYLFIIIIMAMNAVQHGIDNDNANEQTLTVRCSSDTLSFYNKVYDECSIHEIETGRRYWHIPPWVFDDQKQHITIWTFIHMSPLQEPRIRFEAMYDKGNKEFITKFIFKEDQNESSKNI